MEYPKDTRKEKDKKKPGLKLFWMKKNKVENHRWTESR